MHTALATAVSAHATAECTHATTCARVLLFVARMLLVFARMPTKTHIALALAHDNAKWVRRVYEFRHARCVHVTRPIVLEACGRIAPLLLATMCCIP